MIKTIQTEFDYRLALLRFLELKVSERGEFEQIEYLLLIKQMEKYESQNGSLN